MQALARGLGRGVIEEIAARPKQQWAFFWFNPLVAAPVSLIWLLAVRGAVAHLPSTLSISILLWQHLILRQDPHKQYLVHRNAPPSKAFELSLLAAAPSHLLTPLTLLSILLAAEALWCLLTLVVPLPSYAGTPRFRIEVAALSLFLDSLALMRTKTLPHHFLHPTRQCTAHSHHKQTPEKKVTKNSWK